MQIVVCEGAVDSGVTLPLDMLRAANLVADDLARRDGLKLPRFEAELSSFNPRVTLASGMSIDAGKPLNLDATAIVVPGRWVESEAELDRWRSGSQFAALVASLSKAAEADIALYGACTAVNALAATGILDGKEATTTWWLAGSFARAYPKVHLDPSRAVIALPKVATAGAVFAQSDLLLHLIRRHMGPSVARAVTRYLMLDEHPGQTPYMALGQLRTEDPVIAVVDDYARRNLRDISGVDELANAGRVSSRTLDRRMRAAYGLSTGRWLRRMRVEAAVHLLETSRKPVAAIATEVGLGSPVTLRRELRVLHATTPGQVRSRMRNSADS